MQGAHHQMPRQVPQWRRQPEDRHIPERWQRCQGGGGHQSPPAGHAPPQAPGAGRQSARQGAPPLHMWCLHRFSRTCCTRSDWETDDSLVSARFNYLMGCISNRWSSQGVVDIWRFSQSIRLKCSSMQVKHLCKILTGEAAILLAGRPHQMWPCQCM